MFVHREEYYLDLARPDPASDEYAEWSLRKNEVRGKAEVIVAKHRHGPTGFAELYFDAGESRFHDGEKENDGGLI